MTTLLGAVAGTIEAGWNVLYSSVVSVTETLGAGKSQPASGFGTTAEGFYPTSTYGKDFEAGVGADDVWKQYAPYLHQTERSSREQRDNHRWPTTRELLGSEEQALRDREPVLPCHYPRPSLKASRWNA
jgi:hypothetical protein